MMFNKRYINALATSNKCGTLIKLIRENIHIWSTDNYRCIDTICIKNNLDIVVYYIRTYCPIDISAKIDEYGEIRIRLITVVYNSITFIKKYMPLFMLTLTDEQMIDMFKHHVSYTMSKHLYRIRWYFTNDKPELIQMFENNADTNKNIKKILTMYDSLVCCY